MLTSDSTFANDQVRACVCVCVLCVCVCVTYDVCVCEVSFPVWHVVIDVSCAHSRIVNCDCCRYLAEELANAGLVSMVFANTPAYLAPHGGKKRVFGTNPMAFGWPRDGHPPLVWDQASSAMARGEVELTRQAGRQLAPGVGIGPDGEPSTDPATVLAGCQLPFGGFKVISY